ncbi:oligosaccharide flippase family protein [Sphingomonas pseudosanguinis]|uniref:O-antigen/teichoic acid export membrane protein n=1 Tax=Sphingomonas pseudosanguinis TaxID=413712 RepID=A0A7W6A8V3_9SPHN|nr:oligosaccharide flippase family protein [Sphingomonas pseudosanguinis]MBB3879304.1 O-antigen/teichoic acid export membrane protein [Sphingomonas pseudosanguinis]MBN3536964.1 oligosaccharide flippase family protein [Sphingomonas pseudosanguinis]
MSGSSIRGAALWSIGSQYIAFSIQFVVSVLISRFFLTPPEMGLYSIALSAAMLVSVLQDFGISRFVAGERNLTDAQVETCFSVSLIFALGIGLLIFVLAWPVAWFYDNVRLTPLLIIIAGSYLVVPFGIVPSAMLQRRMDYYSLFLVNVGAAVVNAAFSLGLAWAGYSAFALAWAAVAQQIARALIGQWRSGIRPPFPPRLEGVGPILRFGSNSSLLHISGAIGTRSPDLVIGRVLTLTAVGLFSRASSLAAQLQMLVSGAVDGVFYPAFARLRDTGADLAAPYQRVVAAYSAATWPAMAFLAAAATPIVLMLYGPRWEGVAPLLAWIAIGQIFFAALPLHVELPILLGKIRRLVVLNVFDTVASIGLLLLGAMVGLEAAAASRIGYGAIWFLLYVGLIRRLTGFAWRGMAIVYLQSLIATLATVAPLLAVYRWVAAPDAVGLMLLAGAAVAGVLAWLVVVYALRHPIRLEINAIVGGVWTRFRCAKAPAGI